MSTANYMDEVPVKISENYKPLPKVFQVPQAIANKLQLPAQHYHEAPQYAYDFQLEKKVLAKIPEWQRMRQQEREERRERKQRREEQRLRAVEQQNKQMLGAVSYPDAEDLETNSDNEEVDEEKLHEEETQSASGNTQQQTSTNGPRLAMSEVSNFNTILQPTILPQSAVAVSCAGANKPHNSSTQHNRTKSNSSFNYKDFEEDTSSPFDNIELKTINDLDILAQVLQVTQLKANGDASLSGNNANESEETNIVDTLAHAKAALERVDFNIPSADYAANEQTCASTLNFVYATQPAATTHHTYGTVYNQPPLQQQTQQQYNALYNQTELNAAQYASNHNYLFAETPYVANGTAGASYYSPRHVAAQQQYVVGCNANAYLSPSQLSSAYNTPQLLPVAPSADEAAAQHEMLNVQHNSKSKSVPDILKELADEVRNSEMRRTRNYSHNTQQSEEVVECEEAVATTTVSANGRAAEAQHHCYAQLEADTQQLAKTISSMGFPLERVAKLAQMFGADDKKIIEHLIPLCELIDLGFEEAQISEALIRFDNNKDKALEHLIS